MIYPDCPLLIYPDCPLLNLHHQCYHLILLMIRKRMKERISCLCRKMGAKIEEMLLFKGYRPEDDLW